MDADKDPDNNWFTFKLKDVGVPPIKVSEGQEIHCCLKVMNDDYRRTWYGQGGYKEHYSVKQDQEWDFTTGYSDHNDNNTSSDWGQIPFILYSD